MKKYVYAALRNEFAIFANEKGQPVLLLTDTPFEFRSHLGEILSIFTLNSDKIKTFPLEIIHKTEEFIDNFVLPKSKYTAIMLKSEHPAPIAKYVLLSEIFAKMMPVYKQTHVYISVSNLLKGNVCTDHNISVLFECILNTKPGRSAKALVDKITNNGEYELLRLKKIDSKHLRLPWEDFIILDENLYPYTFPRIDPKKFLQLTQAFYKKYPAYYVAIIKELKEKYKIKFACNIGGYIFLTPNESKLLALRMIQPEFSYYNAGGYLGAHIRASNASNKLFQKLESLNDPNNDLLIEDFNFTKTVNKYLIQFLKKGG